VGGLETADRTKKLARASEVAFSTLTSPSSLSGGLGPRNIGESQMKTALTLATIAVLAVAPATAQTGTKFSAVGEWTIYRDFDPMGGTSVCTAAYKDDTSVQLNKGAIAFAQNQKISVTGYHLRWDDDPANEVKFSGPNAKKMSAFFLTDADFAKLQNSKRLRMQVDTLSKSVVNYDIDLKSVPQVIAALKAPNCNH
jgi:hypothetical protein